MKENMDQEPHILILPFPTQGHIKPLLSIAGLLCEAGLHVTFVNSDHNHQRLTNLQVLSNNFPTLQFESIPDGLPVDHPRDNIRFVPELLSSIEKVMKPLFRELLVDYSKRSELPVTCIILDVFMSLSIDFAKELGIRMFAFRSFSAAFLWSYCCLPKLIEEGQVPIQAEEDMDQIVTGVPGMEGLLRRRDLPSFCRQPRSDPAFKLFIDDTEGMLAASGLIINTFDDIEAQVLSHMAPLFSNVYTIGPLTAVLRSRIRRDVLRSISSSGNLWQPDHSCMKWLDSQPLRSVVYVSFGSLAKTRRDQLLELFHGLVNSGKPFLWVIRQDSVAGDGMDEIPEELQVGTKERGFLVDWAPQEDVLAHKAVGGFFTHSGWNSTLEAIVAGVPMICWPQFGDHLIISRWVGEVWRIGLDMKDTCDRLTVERMIRTLMDGRREEFVNSMDRISELAKKCVSQGGYSYNNLEKLIEDMRKI